MKKSFAVISVLSVLCVLCAIAYAAGVTPFTGIKIGSGGILSTAGTNTFGAGNFTSLKVGGYTVPGFRGALLYTNGTQTIADATTTLLRWDNEAVDTEGAFDAAAPTRITTGIVTRNRFSMIVTFSTNTNGVRCVRLKHGGVGNDSNYTCVNASPIADRTSVSLALPVTASQNSTYFEVEVYQNSGSTLTIYNGGGWGTWFSYEYID